MVARTDTHYVINGTTFIKITDLTIDNPYYTEIVNSGLYVTEPSVTEIKIKEIERRITILLDTTANKYGYDNIISACTYAIARGKFQNEGIKFAEWRTDVWAYCYQELDKIQNGLRSEPTIDEFMTELPQLII